MIAFNDLSLIADMAGNALVEPQIKAFLLPYEYIAPTEEDAVESTGLTMKIGVLSLFFGQMAMTLFVQASM